MTVPSTQRRAPLRPPPRLALLVTRAVSYRSGRILLSGCAALASAALAFAAARQIGISRTGAWVLAGAIALLYFAYLVVFL